MFEGKSGLALKFESKTTKKPPEMKENDKNSWAAAHLFIARQLASWLLLSRMSSASDVQLTWNFAWMFLDIWGRLLPSFIIFEDF